MSMSFDHFKTYLVSGNSAAPASIRRFDIVSKIGVGLSVFGFLISALSHQMMMAGGVGALIGFLVIALNLFILYMIVMQGKLWAKWVFVILYAIGLVGFILSIGMIFMFGLITGLINLVHYGLGGYATYLLFQKDSEPFFK